MRVLFVTNMWPDEARPWYGTFIETQARSLQSLGHDVRTVAIRGYQSKSEYLRAIPVVRADAANADVVHAHYGHSAVVARAQLRRPLVVSYCGDDLLGTATEGGGTTVRSRVEAALFRQVARVADATITKSAEMEAVLPVAARARNSVIPNGVDLARFRPGSRAAARTELGWPDEERAVLFVGNPDVAAKNHALAAAVCARARESVDGLRLRVAWGEPPERMPTLMSAADALLFPSRSEGSPNAVKEALAMELPVVATAVGDVPERLMGLDGCYAGAPDVDGLARALVEALRVGRVPDARRRAEELSLERVAERVSAVYAEAVERHRASRLRSRAARLRRIRGEATSADL
jgi:teichuronic acid biosynthesis glycosyltransferase TuaC